nr:hypothetical protein C1892_24065 [Pseudomonas sp. MPBD7-1]
MEWKGLNKSVNAERSKGYHVAGVKMMTNVYGRCVRCMGRGRRPGKSAASESVLGVSLSLRLARSTVA